MDEEIDLTDDVIDFESRTASSSSFNSNDPEVVMISDEEDDADVDDDDDDIEVRTVTVNEYDVRTLESGIQIVKESELIGDSSAIAGYEAQDVSLFDDQGHFVAMDFMDNLNPLFFSCQIETSTQTRVLVSNAGPIKGWTLEGLHFGEILGVRFGTEFAQYIIKSVHIRYKALMTEFLGKCVLVKSMYEVLDDIQLKGDQTTFGFKNLIERLSVNNPNFELQISRHGSFVLSQIVKHDETRRFLDSLAFQEFTYHVDNPTTVREPVTPPFQWTAPGPMSRRVASEFIIDPTATTTPLVQNAFQNIFKNQIRPNNHLLPEQGQPEPISLDGIGDEHVARRRPWFVNWQGNPINRTRHETFYNTFETDQGIFSVGDFVLVRNSNATTISKICLLSQNERRDRVAHVIKFFRGHDTVLGHASDPKQLFASTSCGDVRLEQILKKVEVVKYEISDEEWRNIGGTVEALRTPSTSHPDRYWFRLQFCDATSRFESIAPFVSETFESKTGKCSICEWRQKQTVSKTPKFMGNKFCFGDQVYEVCDAVFLTFGTFKVDRSIRKGYEEETHPDPKTVDENRYPEYYRYFDKSLNKLKGNYSSISDPLQIGIIEKILQDDFGKVLLKIRAMLRPENTTEDPLEVSKSDLNLLFWTENLFVVDAAKVEGKCVILPFNQVPHHEPVIWAKEGRHRFYYQQSYSTRFRRVSDLTHEAANYRPPEKSLAESERPEMKGNPLLTLDLFSGCGGLSVGLEMSGVAKVKWGIEFNENAATAFQQNHPEAKALCMNVNDVLSILLNGEKKNERLPFPRKGKVEFICCGPPCQGFSGLNRFRDRADAQFNNSQIAACLSYLDFFRPKYFLMENVKNMFTHQSGVYLKLILRTIIGMGYQVTQGVLQTGNHGVPQDRSRAFVLAAAPSVKLPIFPEPETAFARPSQILKLDGKVWNTNSWWKSSAPHRNVTTREAISDLPRIHNGSSIETMAYRRRPESHFQKLMRADAEGNVSSQVVDHVCKKLSPLVQARISLIPARPGADWRDLPNIVWQLADGTKTEKLRYIYNDGTARDISRYKGVCECQVGPKMRCKKKEENQKNSIIPWAKVHTARRNGMWAGCYGRVAYESYFSTVTTEPDPEAKQGRVVHPDVKQKRIFSVREFARAQGMPDSFILFGPIEDKYRQIGNAVPPPLATAIGLEIRKALADK